MNSPAQTQFATRDDIEEIVGRLLTANNAVLCREIREITDEIIRSLTEQFRQTHKRFDQIEARLDSKHYRTRHNKILENKKPFRLANG